MNILQLQYGNGVTNVFEHLHTIMDPKKSPADLGSAEQRVVPLKLQTKPHAHVSKWKQNSVTREQRVPIIDKVTTTLRPKDGVPDVPNPLLHLMPQIWSMNHMFDQKGHKLGIDALLTGPMADTWWKGLDNELGRLSSGIPGTSIEGSNTIDFIRKQDVPKGACVTYANMVCNKRPLKKEKS